ISTYNYNIAEIYYVTGNYEKAIELVNNNIKAANIDDQISYYELLAFIYQIKNDKIKSKNNYQKATNLTIEFYTEESIEAAIAYLNYSNFLISIAQFNEAEKILEKSFQIIQLNKPLNGLVLSKYNKTKGLIANLKPVESHDFESFKALKKQNIIYAIDCFKQGLKPLNFPDNYNLINSLESGKILSLIECITILKLIAES